MTQNCDDVIVQQQCQTIRAPLDGREANMKEEDSKQDCHLLLNNFLIKKRNSSVLLNSDHIVWQDLADRHTNAQSKRNTAITGTSSNLLYIADIITVQSSDDDKTTAVAAAQNATQARSFTSNKLLTIYYAARVVKSATDCNRWRVRNINFYNSDAYIIQRWHTAIANKLAAQQRIQRLLVFVNPYGGRRHALKIYERHCKPLFQLAGIDAACIITQRANQIRDILMSHDLAPYNAVCCVGGDGTVAEVINGLLFRSIRDEELDIRRPKYIPKPALPMGIIPAGSTDTVAYSLHGTADVRTAAIHVVLGQRRGLDICSVGNSEGLLRFCASVLSYGYLGDVAAKSEKYRWMGTNRYEYAGMKAFLKNRGYDAEIQLLVPNIEDDEQQSSDQGDIQTQCYANCQRCNLWTTKQSCAQNKNYDKIINPQSSDRNTNEKPSSSSTSSSIITQKCTNKLTYTTPQVTHVRTTHNERLTHSDNVISFNNSNVENCDRTHVIDKRMNEIPSPTISNNCEQKHSFNKKDDINPISLSIGQTINPLLNPCSNISFSNLDNFKSTTMVWKVIKGSFFMICGTNITCACSRSPNGISRYSHLGDGYIDIILVRKTSLLNNIRFVMNTMGRNGDIRTLPFVEVYRTKAFCFRAKRSKNEEYSLSGSRQPITAIQFADENYNRDGVSCWNCDGEIINDLDINMSSHCQLIEVFMRGPYKYEEDPVYAQKSRFCCCHSNK